MIVAESRFHLHCVNIQMRLLVEEYVEVEMESQLKVLQHSSNTPPMRQRSSNALMLLQRANAPMLLQRPNAPPTP